MHYEMIAKNYNAYCNAWCFCFGKTPDAVFDKLMFESAVRAGIVFG